MKKIFLVFVLLAFSGVAFAVRPKDETPAVAPSIGDTVLIDGASGVRALPASYYLSGAQSARPSIVSRNYDKVVKVATTITAALASITDSSAYKKYLLYVPNGTYNEEGISTPPYVDIVGESQVGVIVQSSSGVSDTFLGQDNAMIANMTIKHTNNTGDPGVYQYPIHIDYPPSNTTPAPATATKNSTFVLYNVTVMALGTNSKAGIGIGLYPSQRLYIIDCTVSSTCQDAIFAHNQSGATLSMNLNVINTVATGFWSGFHYSNIGSSSGGDIVRLSGGVFTGSTRNDILVDNTTGAGETFVAIDPTAKYSTSSFVDPTKLLRGPQWTDTPTEPSNRWTGWSGPIAQYATGEQNYFSSPINAAAPIVVTDTTDSTSPITGSIKTAGGISAVKRASVGSLVVRPLYTPTRTSELQMPLAVSTEDYFRSSCNGGGSAIYGGEYGFGLDSSGNTFLRINRINNGTVTGVLSVNTSTGAVAATGSWTFSGAVLSNSGIGYPSAVGVGSAIAQSTSKSTGVTLNNICGIVTMSNATLAANTSVSFTLTNSTIGATDVVVAAISSAATAGAYVVQVDAMSAGSCRISVRNLTAGSLTEAIAVSFVVIKSANN